MGTTRTIRGLAGGRPQTTLAEVAEANEKAALPRRPDGRRPGWARGEGRSRRTPPGETEPTSGRRDGRPGQFADVTVDRIVSVGKFGRKSSSPRTQSRAAPGEQAGAAVPAGHHE